MRCPLCNELKTELYFDTINTHGSLLLSHERFTMLRCQSCGTIFPKVIFTEDFLKRYYPNKYYNNRKKFINKLEILYSKFINGYLNLYISRFIRKGKLLDFGCGKGIFLKSLPSRYEKYGYDINPQAMKLLKDDNSGIIPVGSIEKISRGIKFNIITLWHVIEHVNNPVVILKKLSNLLDNNGVIILSTPNSDSIGFLLSKEHWFHLDAPRHLAIFNFSNIDKLINSIGLEIISKSTPIFDYPLDFFWSVFNRIRTKYKIVNLLEILVLLSVNALVKTLCVFFPRRAETILVVCRKRK